MQMLIKVCKKIVINIYVGNYATHTQQSMCKCMLQYAMYFEFKYNFAERFFLLRKLTGLCTVLETIA